MLSDSDVYERLGAAIEALGDEVARTQAGNTAIASGRMALAALQMALLAAVEQRDIPPPPY